MAGISRRTLLVGAAATVTVASAAGSASGASFVKGADVSWLPQMEAAGYTFKNASGTTQDLFTILAGYGINAIRCRTWVNPSTDPVNGHCSITETAALAKRAAVAGMAVDINFHFGDTWNSVGVQNPPAAWASMTYSQMQTAMYNYAYHSMNVIKSAGVSPSWVQLGNETNSGVCHPIGSISQPAQMTGLLNAAHDMVKEVFPNAQTLIHLAQPQNLTSLQSFYSAYSGNGGKWDICAFSSYGSASGAAGIVANMASIGSTYGKPVMQVEFGGRADRVSTTEAALEAYITQLKKVGALGLFYWEPEVYSPFSSYTMGAWDATTREPTTIMNGFLNA